MDDEQVRCLRCGLAISLGQKEAAARIERLRAALQRIADMCPATAELTLAHEMADNAMAALGGVDDDTY